MKKLALDIDELVVESFEIVERVAQEGTVHAYADTQRGNTCVTQCATGPCDCLISDGYSCDNPCGPG